MCACVFAGGFDLRGFLGLLFYYGLFGLCGCFLFGFCKHDVGWVC